jgi:hypothetical protein
MANTDVISEDRLYSFWRETTQIDGHKVTFKELTIRETLALARISSPDMGLKSEALSIKTIAVALALEEIDNIPFFSSIYNNEDYIQKRVDKALDKLNKDFILKAYRAYEEIETKKLEELDNLVKKN